MTDENFQFILSKLDEHERKIHNIAETVAAVADDTLRVCILLEELSNAGKIPSLPWPLATMLVEVHHAKNAKDRGDVLEGNVPLDEHIRGLLERVSRLREELYHGTTRG